MQQSLKIAVIAGEESGDLLAADLIAALTRLHGTAPQLVGVGGHHLQSLGLKSLFDMQDIALMGLGAVLARLPRLIRHIHHTAAAIVAARPDCLIVIDSPDFTHRVAKKVKKKLPSLPIIHYIAPSVWAWRPRRAARMCAFIDHVLAVLPFEPQVMADLDGPPTTYVGHRLLSDTVLNGVRTQRLQKKIGENEPPSLLLLPGSRRFEITRLMPLFGQTVAILKQSLPNLRLILPTLPRIEAEITALAADWPVTPEIVVGTAQKWQAFNHADVALAASGTVSLELALAGIPMVLTYKADWFSKTFLMPQITIWSAALPNIIADAPIVPEYFNEFIRPGMVARQLRRLMAEGPARTAQMQGFAEMMEAMQTNAPAGDIAAEAVLGIITVHKQSKN